MMKQSLNVLVAVEVLHSEPSTQDVLLASRVTLVLPGMMEVFVTMKTKKLTKVLGLSIIGLFALVGCDEVVTKPTQYEEPLISTPASFNEEIYHNIASVVYDSVHDWNSNRAISHCCRATRHGQRRKEVFVCLYADSRDAVNCVCDTCIFACKVYRIMAGQRNGV